MSWLSYLQKQQKEKESYFKREDEMKELITKIMVIHSENSEFIERLDKFVSEEELKISRPLVRITNIVKKE